MPTNVKTLTTQQLMKEVRQLAKQANQRLVRLEQNGMQTSLAYQKAQARLHGIGRTGKAAGLRFKENPQKMTRQELEIEWNIAKKFIDMQTSRVGGVKEQQKNSLQAFAQKMGVAPGSINKNVYNNLWKAFGDKTAKHSYGSEQISELVKEAATGNISEDEAKQIYQSVVDKLSANKSQDTFAARDVLRVQAAELEKVKKKKKKKKTNRKRRFPSSPNI